jgi:magnesium transporter
LLRELGSRFGLHRLTLEDVLTGVGAARTEAFQGYLFVVMPRAALLDGRLQTDQLSVVMTSESVLSLHDTEGDPLAPVRERLRNPHGHLRNSGPDYLAYALVDSLVDEYYPVLSSYDEALDALEELVVANPEPSQLLQIRHLKDDLQVLRRAVWSMREVAAQLMRDDTRSFSEETHVYLRSVYAHTVELLELVEILRETLFGLTDLYLATQGHRMNEIMKVLTLVATIFIPLTFVVGVYGMNFDYMPELRSRNGYPAVLILMATAAVLMLWYFRRKKWL